METESSARKLSAAIVGSGNIGTDLMEKLRSSNVLNVEYMVGIDPNSVGLARGRDAGIKTSAEGVDWLLRQTPLPSIVFEATSASVHVQNASRYKQVGIRAVDLTPAAIGPYVVPSVNLREHLSQWNVNMITCGGQATVPIVHAVSRVTRVSYAEIVATIASASAGPGTRANIDEFTRTTARAIESVGRAERGKAIIILNPAEPPLLMRDTIFCSIDRSADRERIVASIWQMVAEVARYVPGYRLREDPQFDEEKVSVFLEVEGNADYLPAYAGNLDIMTAAAVNVGEQVAQIILEE